MAGNKKEKVQAKKPNVFVRFGRWVAKTWRVYRSEMRKVVWMPWKDVKKSSFLVIVTALAFAIAIGLVDTMLAEIIKGFAGLIG